MIARGAEVVGSSEHEDSGQAHALHILRSLVHDGGLSQVWQNRFIQNCMHYNYF